MSKKLLFLTLIISMASKGAYAEEACLAEAMALTAAQSEFEKEANKAASEMPQAGAPPPVCVGGNVRWRKKSISFDLPVVAMVNKEWKTKLPQIKLNRKEYSWGQPIVTCQNKVTGRYPVYKQRGLRITVKWKDIITKVCWPEIQTKKVALDVPEVSMRTQQYSMKMPKFTLNRKDLSFDYPEFYTDSSCIASNCAKVCERVTIEQTQEAEGKFETAVAASKLKLLTASSVTFSCQKGVLIATKTELLDSYEKLISVADATAKAMAIKGLVDEAFAQNENVKKMRSDQVAAVKELDEAIGRIESEQQNLAKQLGVVAE